MEVSLALSVRKRAAAADATAARPKRARGGGLVGPPPSAISLERLANIERYTLWKGRIV